MDYRAANVRAGYVYVISNIGAFGEHMVKIGMTRRLDPRALRALKVTPSEVVTDAAPVYPAVLDAPDPLGLAPR